MVMGRSLERLIDVLVLGMLLTFAYAMRGQQPGLAGVVIAAAIQFWMVKNATLPTTSENIAEKTAEAAASALLRKEERDVARGEKPRDVEIVGQADAVEVFELDDD